mgnify:FL=1
MLLKYEKKEIFLHEHALEKLCSYHWPGNIRELQHTIEKAVILCEGGVIRSKDIFVKQTWSPQFSTTVPNLEEVERQAIETAIRQKRWKSDSNSRTVRHQPPDTLQQK